jgi:predicted porin
MGGFSASLQGVWDQTDVLNGGGLIALEYTHDNFSVFAGAAYTDLDDSVGSVSTSKLDSGGNWKVGGTATFAGMKLGLQYEHAEIGTLTDSSFAKVKNGVTTIAPIAGKYLLGSIDFRADNLAIGGWVAKYSESTEELQTANIKNQKGKYNNDALSFAVGLKYFLSKRTLAFGGYQQTNSENNIYDQKVVGVGVRHSF